ncbi:MAG: CsgG/HfaB family protein [Tepidisphaeraceae bacterium]
MVSKSEAVSRFVRGAVVVVAIAATLAAGCSSGGGASIQTSVGNYYAPPPGIAKGRVGVSEFKVEAGADDPLAAVGSLGEFAGDEVATLLAKSGRFNVVGRVALAQSLGQQGLSGVIEPGTLVRPATINGVEYVLVGTLSNLSIAKRPATPGMMGKMKSWVKQSTQNKQVQVIANCNVAMKLIEPKTGDIMLSTNSQFSRTGGATAMGIDVLDAAALQSGDCR